MYKKPEIIFILVAIFIKIFLVNTLSVSFEYDWIYQMWHFIDVEYLKKDLLKSLYYFHYQPPVFNLFLGLILKQKVINPESLLYFAFNLMTIGMFGGMFFYYKARTKRKMIYVLFPVIFLFSPQTIIYENWPIYTWTSSFLILMGYFCLAKIKKKLMLKSLMFFSVMALLILSRSAFHPVFYIFFLLFFSLKYRTNFKEFIIGATIPSLIILSIMIKNKIEFGFAGVGSGLGFSLYKIVSKKDLDNRIQQSNGELDDIMKITPVKSISTYLRNEEAIYSEKHKRIGLLNEEFKSTRKKFGDEFSVNLGNIHYLDLAKRYQKGALYLIKNYPLEYIGIRAGEKIDEVLVSHEEMRRAQEKKDHFVIQRESDFDVISLKKSLKTIEYDSGAVSHLGVKELKEIMKKLNWIL